MKLRKLSSFFYLPKIYTETQVALLTKDRDDLLRTSISNTRIYQLREEQNTQQIVKLNCAIRENENLIFKLSKKIKIWKIICAGILIIYPIIYQLIIKYI